MGGRAAAWIEGEEDLRNGIDEGSIGDVVCPGGEGGPVLSFQGGLGLEVVSVVELGAGIAQLTVPSPQLHKTVNQLGLFPTEGTVLTS